MPRFPPLVALVAAASLVSGCQIDDDPPPPSPPGRTVHVAADAAAGGDGSGGRPFASLAEGVGAAMPGDTVAVGPGTYPGPIVTVRAGRPGAPIRLVGAGPSSRIVGSGSGRLVQVLHSYVSLTSFDISGADILVWVHHATGVKIAGNVLHDAGGECVRLKYFSHHNEVSGNRIGPCGLEGFDLDDDHKNGEGVYVGTAPEQLDRNPTDDPDRSDANRIHDNVVSVPAECVDVKEAATANEVTGNRCTGSRDPEGGGFSSRGQGTVFRGNTSTGHAGAGIRLGGDTGDDGVDSSVVGNRLSDNEGYGVKVMREPQAAICGNDVDASGRGATNGTADPSTPC